MEKIIYIIGSEPIDEWERKHDFPKWIVMTGEVSAEEFDDLAGRFDYTKYERITFENVKVKDVIYDNGYSRTFKAEWHFDLWDDSIKPYVLVKLLFNSSVVNDFIVSDGNVYSYDMKTIAHVPEQEEITIPGFIENIGPLACCGYEKLTKLNLNEGLRSIGEHAFEWVGVTELTLPDTLVSLGECAFRCSDLEKIKLSESLEAISDDCFSLCLIDKITIPASVRYIGDGAFRRGLLQHNIVIPEGVEEIGYDTFDFSICICLPSTLKKIAKDFYYEECVDAPDYPPYVKVHPDNPVFFSKDGTLYFKETGELALDSKYNGLNPSFSYS